MVRCQLLISFCWLASTLNAGSSGLYPVRIGPNHRHLVDQSGNPFLVQGDAPWSLISGLTREEAEGYLETRRRQGFNSVIVKAAEKGIQVFLAPIYLGYIGTDEGWIEEAIANGPEKCRAWGRYVGKRYRAFDNLV